MSFSGEIKEELSTLVPAAHHCRLAETAAILLFCGKIILTETDSCCKNTDGKSSGGKKVLYITEKNI